MKFLFSNDKASQLALTVLKLGLCLVLFSERIHVADVAISHVTERLWTGTGLEFMARRDVVGGGASLFSLRFKRIDTRHI